MSDVLTTEQLYRAHDVFNTALGMTLTFEGGVDRNEVGSSGISNRGITQQTYDSFLKQNKLPPKKVTDLTEGETSEFYRKEFFERPKLDTLPDRTSILTFDFGVNASPKTAVKALQEVVGSKADGIIGNNTRKAVNSFIKVKGEQTLLQGIIDKREEHNESLIKKNPTKYKKFEDGWKNRIQQIKDTFDLSILNPFHVGEAEAGQKDILTTEELNQLSGGSDILTTEELEGLNKPSFFDNIMSKFKGGKDVMTTEELNALSGGEDGILTTEELAKPKESSFLGKAIANSAANIIAADVNNDIEKSVESSLANVASALNDTITWIGTNIGASDFLGDRAEENKRAGLPTDEELIEDSGLPEEDKQALRDKLDVHKQSVLKKENVIKGIGDKIVEFSKSNSKYFQEVSQKVAQQRTPELFQGDFLENPSFVRTAALVAEAIPSLGVATAVTFLTGNPFAGGAAIGFTLEAAPQFREALEAGSDLDKANVIFLASGTGNSILESLPLGRFFRGGSGKLTKDIFTGSVEEGLQEGVQAIYSNAIAKIGYDNTRDLTEGMIEGIIAGAGSGGVLGGLTSGRPMRTDALIEKAVEKGIPPEHITIMSEVVGSQIVANKDKIDKVITENVIEGVKEEKFIKLEPEVTKEPIVEKKALETPPEGTSKDIVIPEFKNTNEAIEFGIANKDNTEVLEALQQNREEIRAKAKELLDKKDATEAEEAEAFRLSQIAQFPREAIEAAEGKIDTKIVSKSKEILTTQELENKTVEEVGQREETVKGKETSKTNTSKKLDQKEVIAELKVLNKEVTDALLQLNDGKITPEEYFTISQRVSKEKKIITDEFEEKLKKFKQSELKPKSTKKKEQTKKATKATNIPNKPKVLREVQARIEGIEKGTIAETDEFIKFEELPNLQVKNTKAALEVFQKQLRKTPAKGDVGEEPTDIQEPAKRTRPQQANKLEPLETESQRKRREKAKRTKEAQLQIESAKEAKEAIHAQIRQRRFNLNLANFDTNLFINDIEKQTTQQEREIIPFLMEKTNIPEELGRPDLEKVYNDRREALQPIADSVKAHFDKSWEYMKANTENMTNQQIENYVTHIWEVPKSKKAEVSNWFITQNRFLKKRYIATLKEGIQELGLQPKILDIAEIIRVHDNVMNKTIENAKFLSWLKQMKTPGGTPLIAPSHKAPANWVSIYHPALTQKVFIPSESNIGERPTKDLQDILTEMGVAIGRRLSPTVFGKPNLKAGQYQPSTIPPEINLQKFFKTRTIAHEIGHHIDEVLQLGDEFLGRYKDELYAVNKDRIERLSKSGSTTYGKEYAEATEEQIAEFFAVMFTDVNKAYKLAPAATEEIMAKLRGDQVLTKLVDFDFEQRAKILIDEQANTLIPVPLKFHPDLEKPLRVIFDSRIHHPVVQAYENVNGWLKKTRLSISLFHHFALGETSVSLTGAAKTADLMFNPVRLYNAIRNNKFDVFEKQDIARKWVSRGLQFGATQDIPVNRIQAGLNEFARKTKNIPLANKMTELTATFNEVWDKALWSYLHDTLKLYGAEALSSQVDPSKNVIQQEEEIAQIVNDTFGGQNWEVLMIDPKMQQVLSWMLLSPDWTISTMRQALAPTGIGSIHKTALSKKLRRKIGSLFWMKAALYFGVGINLLNMLFRRRDEEDNPQFYTGQKPDGVKDYSMFGNTIGHKTHLFVGRYKDGTERYIRWGKQFREFPELLFDKFGFSPITATLKKLGGKLAPVIQDVAVTFTGVSPSGFVNRDIQGKQGWERVWGITKNAFKSPLPFSARNLMIKDKEFHITDMGLPSSKGMSKFQARKLFMMAIEEFKKNGDERPLKEVYQNVLRNNLSAYTLYKSALTTLKSDKTREINKTFKDVVAINEALRTEKDSRVRKTLFRKKKRLLKETAEKETGIKQLKQVIKQLEDTEI